MKFVATGGASLVSPHFSRSELLTTSRWDDVDPKTGLTYGALQERCYAQAHIESALDALCLRILEPVRTHVGGPVHVDSGLRCPELNAVTPGASATTQHVKGEAADIKVLGWTDLQLYQLFLWIADESQLPFGQVIFEDRRPDDPARGAWIHVSLGAGYRAAERCGEVLVWNPRTGYQRLK